MPYGHVLGGSAEGLHLCTPIYRATAPGKWFHILWRDQPYRVTKGRKPATPMLRAAARFQGYHCGRQFGEESLQLRPPDVAAQDSLFVLVEPCNVNTALDVSRPMRLRFKMPWGHPLQQ